MKSISLSLIILLVFIVGCTLGNAGNKVKNDAVRDTFNNVSQEEQEQPNRLMGSYQMNEKFVLEGVEYTTLDIRCCYNRIGNEWIGTEPKGTFLKVDVEIKNAGKDAIYLSPNNIKLMDKEQRIYEPDPEWIDTLNPGISKKFILAFDVPKDLNTADSKIIVQSHNPLDENFVYVTLTEENWNRFTEIPSETKSISLTNEGYSPPDITIYEEDTIIWTNEDAKPHEIYVYTCNPKREVFNQLVKEKGKGTAVTRIVNDEKVIERTDQARHKFYKKGTYQYGCEDKPGPFDTGKITVLSLAERLNNE